MKNSKGTISIEVIFIAAMALIAVILIAVFVSAAVSKRNYCDFYRYSTISETPVACFEYLTNTDDNR